MHKGIYLIIENCFPTVHPNLKEAKEHYKIVVRNSGKQLNAMYFKYTTQDFKENFCNCICESLIKTK